jgi:hypothetical protein
MPITVERTHDEYSVRERADSIFIRDSVTVFIARDTVYRYRERLVYRDRLLRDTVAIRDSIPYHVYVETIRTVRHIPPLYRWCLRAVIAMSVWQAIRIWRRIRR